MEHPLVGDISHLSIDEIQVKINELHKKMQFAHRIGNKNLVAQIQLVLQSYNSQYQEKQKSLYQDGQKSSDGTFSDKINIS